MAEGGMSGADWASLIAGLGGATVTAIVNSRNNRRNAEVAEDELDQRENSDVRDVALKESLADPFRHQRSQYQNLAALDMLKQFGSGGPRITPPANVARFTGTSNGGYRPSANMLGAIDALEQDIRGGHTAPTMTDPANFGRTSAININAANGQGSGAPAGSTVAPFRAANTFLPDQSKRRNEGAGGVGAGMRTGLKYGSMAGPYGAGAGLVAGGIAGAFTKNAPTAATDLSVDQARQVLDTVYREVLGRQASPDEIDNALRGQGLKPGDRWVGESGLLSVINQIQQSAEARTRGYGAAAA